MTDKYLERCSAFMDGELSHEETELFVRQLSTDPTLSAVWLRFHAVREVLRGHPAGPGLGVADRVSRDLADEPAHREGRAPVWTRVAGLAAAAAVVAVLALGLLAGDPVAVETPVASGPAVDVSPVDPASERDLERQLGTYVVGHSSYAGLARRQGLLPYAQVNPSLDDEQTDPVPEEADAPAGDGDPEP